MLSLICPGFTNGSQSTSFSFGFAAPAAAMSWS